MIQAGAMAVAMVVDWALGWPAPVFARIGHPVTWAGRLIAALDHRWNCEGDRPARRRAAGMFAACLVIALAAGLAATVQAMLPAGWAGVVAMGILAWPLLALRSLHDHVRAVAVPLAAGDLAGARAAVSMIVGRDPERLDEAGVARAALESLAENASDGIVAPVFWGLLLGLPGIAGYKVINTLDSMIGHRTARHGDFGWAAARIDDVVNLIPARLTGGLVALASGRPRPALTAMLRDARHHRSPNAGWPEAALAGALGVRLSGPRVYGTHIADEPVLNASGRDPGAEDILRGLAVYRRTMALLLAVFAVLALLPA